MLCNLAVTRTDNPDEADLPLLLRISSKHVLGSAGGTMADEAGFTSMDEMLGVLERLHVLEAVLSAARTAAHSEEAASRWEKIGTDVQIDFALLEENGFYLEDQSQATF